MAAGDLTNLTAVKAWLKVQDNTDDSMLGALISDASAFICNALNTLVLSANVVEFYQGNGKNCMLVKQSPITAVSQIRWPGLTLTAQGDPFNNVSGIAFEGKKLLLVNYVFPYQAPIEVTYTAGYATCPPDIAQACVELVGEAYRRRTHIGESSHAAGGNTTVAFEQAAMHKMISQRLANRIRVAPI